MTAFAAAHAAPAAPVRRINKSAIQPRRMDFQFDASIPLYWFDNSQFKSVLLTALSCTFPEGERMFVRSVRHYQPLLKSAQLREEVKGFIGQEAHHGNEHEVFNALMQEKGMPTQKVVDFVYNGIRWQEKRMSPERRLAKTCALEHFTAMLAELMLEHDDLLGGMDKNMLPLWLWHAVEESEHKSVAFDVYQEQVGSYWI
ncbi:MAG: metal-dependent hydrolase, partial [Moraxellaceae bacterium]